MKDEYKFTTKEQASINQATHILQEYGFENGIILLSFMRKGTTYNHTEEWGNTDAVDNIINDSSLNRKYLREVGEDGNQEETA